MRIVFFPVECCPFHGKSLEERPLGGTETAIIRLAEALHAAGQEVYVITQERDPPKTTPVYLNPSEANRLGRVDAAIIVRGWKGAFLPFEAKKRFFWTGDAWDNSHTYGIGDLRFIHKVDAIFPVSAWHADTLCRSSGFPQDKVYVLRNGIHAGYFKQTETRKRKRLIYTSTPGRGLKYLPEIYLELKQHHADLELAVFSSFDRYTREWPPVVIPEDNPYEQLFRKLSDLPDCYLEGSIPQEILSKEFMKASILAYPSDFEETSCITVMEAQAAGCVPVTTALAALPETVGTAGILIPGNPATETYRKQFVAACDRLLSDETYFQTLSAQGKENAKGCDWSMRAQDLLTYLQTQQGLS